MLLSQILSFLTHMCVNLRCKALDQINQNPYFGFFEILSFFLEYYFYFPLLFWEYYFLSYCCFGILFLFPISFLRYYFLSYYCFVILFYFLLYPHYA